MKEKTKSANQPYISHGWDFCLHQPLMVMRSRGKPQLTTGHVAVRHQEEGQRGDLGRGQEEAQGEAPDHHKRPAGQDDPAHRKLCLLHQAGRRGPRLDLGGQDRGVLGAPLQHSDRGANFLKTTDLSYKSGWSRACLSTPRSMASTSGTCHRASFSRMGAPSTRGWRTACCIKSVSSSASMLIMT